MTDEQMDARLRSAGDAWRAATPVGGTTEATEVHPLTDTPNAVPARRRRTGLLASAAIVAAALVAGGSVLIANITGDDGNKAAGMEAAGLQGTVWRFVGYGDHLLPNSLATLYISPDGQLIADDTCDLIGAHASIESGRLVVTDPDVRYYNCTDSVGEVTFDVDVLTSSPSYSIAADGLTITGAGETMHLVAAPHMAVPTLDRPLLTGATWKLVKATDPDGNEVPIDSDATLRIDGGELRASDSCNTLSGPVTVNGTQLEPGELSTTDVGCGELGSIVEAVLTQPARTMLLGTHLTVGLNGAGTLEYEWVPSDEAATDPAGLLDRAWQLTSVAGDPVTDDVELNLHSDDTIAGSDGCRDLGGATAQVSPGVLTIAGIPPADFPPECNGDLATTVDSLLTMRSALWHI